MILVVPRRLCRDSGICKRASYSSRFSPFFGSFDLPCGSHEIERLAVLLFRELVENIAHFVIAAALHRLIAAEAFLDGGSRIPRDADHGKIRVRPMV